jgi:hypothetical protein
MKIGRADSYNKLDSKHEFRENWSTKSHFTEGRKLISIRTFHIWPILVTFNVVRHVIPLSSYNVRENRCRKSHGYGRKVEKLSCFLDFSFDLDKIWLGRCPQK